MKSIILLVGWLVMPLAIFAQSEKNYTLQDCIDLAIQNNYDLRSAHLRAATSDIVMRQNRNALLPSINGSYNYGVSRGRSIDPFTNDFVNEELQFSNARLGLDATVFNGFRLINSWKEARFNLKASEMEVEEAKQNLKLDVTLAFLQVVNGRELLNQTTARIATTRAQLERLQILFEEENINPAEYRDLQGQLANDRAALATTKNNLATAEISLNQIVNHAIQIKAENLQILVDVTPYTSSVEEVYDAALSSFPTFKARNLRVEAAEKGVSVAKAQYIPQVSVFANVGTNYSSAARLFSESGTNISETGDFVTVNGDNFPVFTNQTAFMADEISYSEQFDNNLNSSVGVAVDIPVFNGFRAQNAVAIEKIQLQEAQVALDRTQLEIKQAIKQSYNTVQTAFERYQLLQEQVIAFEESFRINEVRFENGVSTSVDYILSKNNLDTARINLANAKYEYVLRTKILGYYQGAF